MATVTVRLTAEQRAHLDERATENDVTRSEYVRQLIEVDRGQPPKEPELDHILTLDETLKAASKAAKEGGIAAIKLLIAYHRGELDVPDASDAPPPAEGSEPDASDDDPSPGPDDDASPADGANVIHMLAGRRPAG